MPGYGFVTFLSDYGLSDGFVGVCHAIIAELAPAARIIDITHLIPPQNIRRASAVLAGAAPQLPPAVHLAVVDPGVGTTRRGVAIRAGRSLLVGPDNGLLPAAAEALGPISEVFLLNDESWFRTPVSSTFHGRDVFAPVAGRLAAGAQLSAVGDPLPAAELIRLPAPLRQVQTGALAAEAIDVDRFGNVALAAGAPDLATAGFRLGDRLQWQHGFVTLARTFADVAPGEPLLFVDSAGRLALAVRDGSAAERYQLTEGDSIAASAASAS